MAARPTRVMLVDDHPVVRAGFRRLLELEPDISIIAEADGGEQACRCYTKKTPDVVVMDLSMPKSGGIEAIQCILRVAPSARILVLSVHEHAPYPSMALASGAMGYLTKRCAPEELADAIRQLAIGGKYLGQDIATALALGATDSLGNLLRTLTERELEVFAALSRGESPQTVAKSLNVSHKTVHTHKSNVMHKLGVTTTAELVRLAIRHGIVEP